MKYPDWVMKYKKKGTAIHYIKGHYYLYEIESKWDKILKKPKKITKRYLGVITPEGLKEPQYRINKPTTCKEYGASLFLIRENEDIINKLNQYFPHRGNEIFIISLLRLQYQCPLKNIELHYQDSWLSEIFPNAALSKNTLHQILEEVGQNREAIIEFLKSFTCYKENLLIDLTNIFSLSNNLVLAEKGYNNHCDFTPQVNLLFIFSFDKKIPVFYRVLPGSVRDVKSLKATVLESGIKDVIIIGDKGFYSKENVCLLERENLKYILPLKRSNKLIDYRILKDGRKEEFEGYFKFKNRFIWYYRSGSKDTAVWVYVDNNLKTEKEEDYLSRIETHPEECYKLKNFYKNEHTFGTISLITNLKELPAPKIFEYFKSRVEIEQMFDTFKNTLKADRSYMRSDYSLEGWMFINYLSMIYYYRIYKRLIERKLLNRFSVSDVLLILSKYRRVKISTQWIDLEIPKKTKNLIENLNLHIT